MKISFKNSVLVPALALTVMTPSLAFGQVAFFAESSVATQMITPFSNALSHKDFSPQKAAYEMVAYETSTINNTGLVSQAENQLQLSTFPETANSSKWILKPQPDVEDAEVEMRDYSLDFAGIQPIVLGNDKVKIGTSTQFIEAGYVLDIESSKTYRHIFPKVDNNYLLRAKLGF